MFNEGDIRQVVVIRNEPIAQTQRNMFNQLWNMYKQPTKTTASETYE